MSRQLPLLNETPVPAELQRELLALPVAARTVYERVYEHDDADDPSLLLERLDGVASVIARMADLYVREPASRAHRQVSPYDVHTGFFRSGGNELCFKDGRAPITNILVTHSGLECVLSLLQEDQDLRRLAARSLASLGRGGCGERCTRACVGTRLGGTGRRRCLSSAS